MKKNAKNLKKYNPYVFLILEDLKDTYEEEVIAYYNSYKEIYGGREFDKRVMESNDEAVEWAISDFISSPLNLEDSLKELKTKIRGIKNIVLLTEKAKVTKRHIAKIDKMVSDAIDYKNGIFQSVDKQFEELFSLFDSFYANPLLDVAINDLKINVNKLIKKYETIYSVEMNQKVSRKINKMVNKIIDEHAREWGLYASYDISMNELLDKYSSIDVCDTDSYLDWVNNFKQEYNSLKSTMKAIYSSRMYQMCIKVYDRMVDDLIDRVMNKNFYLLLEDAKELDTLFTYYKNTIGDYNYGEYYDYMTDIEKRNLKRQMYVDKNRSFRRNIRDFNKTIRSKYSKRYADYYVNEVNKKADDLIRECAKGENMHVHTNPWFVRKSLWSDTENFVSDRGNKIRRIINQPLRKLVPLLMNNKLVVEEVPNLDVDKQYVFVSTHYFTEDTVCLFAAVPVQAYTLMGVANQIENNPLMTPAKVLGFFHVDRADSVERKECLQKQNILIDKGSSCINYVSGCWEDSENELQPPSYSGAYRTSKLKNVLIVPVASYLVPEDKKVYVRFGDPMDVRSYDEATANEIIRDTLASMHYKQIAKYSYPIRSSAQIIEGKKVITHDLPYDQQKYYLEQTANEYWKQSWTRPFAKEEVTPRSRKVTTEDEVYAFIDKLPKDKLIELSAQLSPIMTKIDEKRRYDVSEYLDSNYEKLRVRRLKRK